MFINNVIRQPSIDNSVPLILYTVLPFMLINKDCLISSIGLKDILVIVVMAKL